MAHLPPPPASRWLITAVAAVAMIAVAVPAWVVAYPPAMPRLPRAMPPPARVVPPAVLPPVEPVAYQDLTPDAARAWNARIPFAGGPNPAARPFRFSGDDDQRARAIDCLAAAMLYEAGDDPVGERAVGQVVLNRVRHPAFPKTVCGVVFQGQERRTGCQFTFTCDGAIARAPDPAKWARAQVLAAQALAGRVVASVGHSTHYHTDWVVPYWSASLDKVAEVHTHLFFRWTGWWGTPPAFRRMISSDEPIVPKLAAWSPAHGLAAALEEAATVMSEPAVASTASEANVNDGRSFVLTVDRAADPESLPALAQRTCGARDYCKLMAWTDRRQAPAQLPPTDPQLATMAFSYLRDRARGFDKPLWNCAIFARTDRRQCMRGTMRAAPLASALSTQAPSVPEPLSGVRRIPRPTVTPPPGPAAAERTPSTPPSPRL